MVFGLFVMVFKSASKITVGYFSEKCFCRNRKGIFQGLEKLPKGFKGTTIGIAIAQSIIFIRCRIWVP